MKKLFMVRPSRSATAVMRGFTVISSTQRDRKWAFRSPGDILVGCVFMGVLMQCSCRMRERPGKINYNNFYVTLCLQLSTTVMFSYVHRDNPALI